MDDWPTNDLIERLVAGLSPEARELHAEMVQAAEAEARERMDGLLARLEPLPGRDREALVRLLDLHAAADRSAAEKHMELARQAGAAAAVIERAQGLEREAGREPDEVEAMTLGEALAVLERHGEDPAVHL